MELENKNPKIYIISGKARSGKDNAADIIEKYYSNKKVIKLSYSYYLKDFAKRITGWDGSDEVKPREFLQQLGIELIKTKINDHFLINRLCDDIKVFSYFYDVIIITDARLVDEIEIPKNLYPNATVIRINRNIDNNLKTNEKKHLTEIGLDNYNKYDYIIENNKTLEELNKKVIEIIRKEDLNEK